MKVLAKRDFTVIPVNFLISGGKKIPKGLLDNMTRVKKAFSDGGKKKNRKKKKKSFYLKIS